MGGRGSSLFPAVSISLTGESRGHVSPLITAGLMELRGNEADPESTLRRIDELRFNNLEHEQLFVVDKEGFVLEGYDGKHSSVAFPTQRALEWKDHIVTHRHPGELGGTFSFADLYNFATFGWSEQEASANEGRYNMRRTKNADGEGLIRQLKRDIGILQEKMREAAARVAEKQFTSRREYAYESRKQQLKVLEDWYGKALPQHGFTYTFTPRKEYQK